MYAKILQTSKHILKSPNLDKIDQIVGEFFTQWIFFKRNPTKFEKNRMSISSGTDISSLTITKLG